jgi:hypothetical protein
MVEAQQPPDANRAELAALHELPHQPLGAGQVLGGIAKREHLSPHQAPQQDEPPGQARPPDC